MIRYSLHGIAIVLSLMFAVPVSAQATVQESSPCQLSIDAHSGMAPAPTADALPRGCETATRPWSAPVGHRQPQAADIASPGVSSIDRTLLEEDAKIDRTIRGICRGC